MDVKREFQRCGAIGFIALVLAFEGNFVYRLASAVYIEQSFKYTHSDRKELKENIKKRQELSNQRYKITNSLEDELEKTHGFILSTNYISKLQEKLYKVHAQLEELKIKQKPFEENIGKYYSDSEYKKSNKNVNINLAKAFYPFYKGGE